MLHVGMGTVTVRVVPRAGRTVVEAGPNGIRVRVRAAPEGGRATEEARRAIASTLDVVPSAVRLIRGAAARRERDLPSMRVKSSVMLGLGETDDEVLAVMQDLRSAGVDVMTLGQYLQPSRRHLPVERFVTPEQFEAFRDHGRELGFLHVESGPLVRSSYHAERHRPDPPGVTGGS